MYPKPIQNLINIFMRFPTVGRKTATRFAFHLLNTDPQNIDQLIQELQKVKTSVHNCKFCYRSLETDKELCSICSDKSRKPILAIVERETDLTSLEKTNQYNGYYFILGGNISPLRKKDLKEVRAKELKARIKAPESFGVKEIEEVIIATNPTTEGEATSLFLERVLEDLNVKVTKLAKGLPVGGELEYADEDTLSSALKGRK
ncbi:MAG: recombination mediator RecR [Patescibacteria group bacterium]